ncbi:MAG: hypothetical protein A2Y14_02630 [Verrucomicrobia bacterium GWF2_51_19]|nr:MAG: hypothetical protein A2Y14_02630 [Verrucomicrobia bacterium GWF2_51_19]
MKQSPEDKEKIRTRIQKYVDRWRGVEGNLIMILHDIQEAEGYVPREWSMELAKALDINLGRIYEVLTFYTYFNLKPCGKHAIHVCTGTACHIKGSAKLIDELKTRFGFVVGETTPDRLYSLNEVRCLGACGLAPVARVNHEILAKATPESLVEKIESLEKVNV